MVKEIPREDADESGAQLVTDSISILLMEMIAVRLAYALEKMMIS